MKLINKLEKSNITSLYSGQSNSTVEMFLRPVPLTDENGVKLKKSARYYVFRLLFFTSDNRTDFPAIVRNEHVFFNKDAAGNIKSVKKICCPTTLWARQRLQEPVDKDYCPICKYSYEQNTEAWKNYRATKQIDTTSLKLSEETKRQWAAYIPVLVVSDPLYKNNNNHLRVLRLSGEEGKAAYNKINDLIFEAQSSGLNVFNGENGVNIAMLCEKQTKEAINRKTGEPIIDPTTGNPRTYLANCITNVCLLTKNLHEYTSFITETAIDNLHFDETYGEPATKSQLAAFLKENYLAHEVTDADFEEDEFSDEFDDEEITTQEVTESEVNTQSHDDYEEDGEVTEKGPQSTNTKAMPSEFEEVEEKTTDDSDMDTMVQSDEFSDDYDDEFDNESPRDAINRITNGRTTTSSQITAPVPKILSKKSGTQEADIQTTTHMRTAVTPKSATKSATKMRNKVVSTPSVEKLREDSIDFAPDDLPF